MLTSLLAGAASSALKIGGGYLGASISDHFQAKSAKRNFAYQLQLLQQQQAWAEKMANSAHQREVIDLRKAGLNPILTATGGQGAATPTVSAPSVTGSAPSVDMDLADAAIDGFNSGQQVAKNEAAVKATNAATDLDKAKVDTEKSQQDLNKALAAEAAAKTKELNAGLPTNRLPGHAINSGKGVIKEGWGLAKDAFDLIKTKLREKDLSDTYNNSAKRAKGTVIPISNTVLE